MDYSGVEIDRTIAELATECQPWQSEESLALPISSGIRPEIEDAPIVRVCNLVMIKAIEVQAFSASISQCDGETHIAIPSRAPDGRSLKLPGPIFPQIIMRFINMLQVTTNRNLVLEGVVPIKWRGMRHRVNVRLSPAQDSVQIDILIDNP